MHTSSASRDHRRATCYAGARDPHPVADRRHQAAPAASGWCEAHTRVCNLLSKSICSVNACTSPSTLKKVNAVGRKALLIARSCCDSKAVCTQSSVEHPGRCNLPTRGAHQGQPASSGTMLRCSPRLKHTDCWPEGWSKTRSALTRLLHHINPWHSSEMSQRPNSWPAIPSRNR